MSWQTLKVGAGGQLTGIDIASDGTKVVRADTYGAYRWDANAVSPGNAGGLGKWVQLVTSDSMPDAAVSPAYSTTNGGFEIRIAPSNTSRFYLYKNGFIYTTTNKGVTWTKTNFSQLYAESNANTKFFGPFLAVDPFNELICYAGTPANGVWFTTDANNWTQISTGTIAVGASYFGSGAANQIAFDATSTHPGNVTQIIYVNSYGTGVYKSANGGSTWTLTTGTPTVLARIFVGQDGILYGNGQSSDTNIYWYDGTWHSKSTGSQAVQASAMDPANSSHLIALSAGGQISTTTTGANGTWSSYNNLVVQTATDIPWLSNDGDTFMTVADCVFDPTVSNVLNLAAGVGVWTSSDTNNPSTITWTSHSVGIEQLDADWAISPPGGNPLLFFFDRPIFTITDQTKYPTQYGPFYTGSVVEGYSGDYASSNPQTIVALCSASRSAVSTNGGGSNGGPSNWTTWANFPSPGDDGAIAASTPTNWVVSSRGGSLNFTTDGAATAWQQCTTGLTEPDDGWGSFSVTLKRQNVCADRVLANTFYAYNSGTVQPGFYVSTNSGATFAFKSSAGGHLGASDNANMQMRSVPGVSGNFYANPCAGINVGTGNGFYEMQWTGTTLTKTAVPGVIDVWGHGFGKAKSGGYPAVFIYGTVDSAHAVGGVGGRSVWRSDDHCITWNNINPGGVFINGWMDQVVCVEGDMNTYGTAYVGFNGSGFAMFSIDSPTVIGGRGTHMKMRLHLH